MISLQKIKKHSWFTYFIVSRNGNRKCRFLAKWISMKFVFGHPRTISGVETKPSREKHSQRSNLTTSTDPLTVRQWRKLRFWEKVRRCSFGSLSNYSAVHAIMSLKKYLHMYLLFLSLLSSIKKFTWSDTHVTAFYQRYLKSCWLITRVSSRVYVA